MPARDKTGPQGAGSMTDRRMGYCAENEHHFGRIYGRRRRLGLGLQKSYHTLERESAENTTTINELTELKNQVSLLRKEIEGLKRSKNL